MKYKLNNTTIELTDEDVANIVKQFQIPTHKRKYFVPNVGEKYWFINEYFQIDWTENKIALDDMRNIDYGNCFATEKDAQDELNRRQSLVRIWNNYDDKYSWDIDWDDEKQVKYSIGYDYKNKVIDSKTNGYTFIYDYSTELPYFKSAEDRNQFVESNRDDILTIFKITI